MTLKYGQGLQTLYKSLDPEQDYNHAKFERSPFKQCLPKKPTLKFCVKSENYHLSPLNMCQSERWWYIQYLLDLLNNPTKFKLSWIKTQIFQLKLFDTAVMLKYGQGH